MTWARVDDAWWCHPKVLGLDLDARGLWVSALSWSCQQATDHVPYAIAQMCGDDGTAAKKLVHAGLWEENGAGWVIHDWDDYQSESAKKAAAGRKGGKKSGESRRAAKQADEADDSASSEAEPGASDEAGPSRPGPTRPDQTLSSPNGDLEAAESDADDAAHDDASDTFEQFWQVYPARNGKKEGKGNALIEWRKRTKAERRRAYRGAVNLARSDRLPKDAERFLRRAKGGKGDFPFDDWQEPAQTHPPPTVHNDVCPDCEQVLSRHDAETCEAVQAVMARG